MIALYPPWPSIAQELNHRYGSDDAVADEVSKRYGLAMDRWTLMRLRKGMSKAPRFPVAAALLNLIAA